jgi:O-antigen/teichoic acid export membrane protein
MSARPRMTVDTRQTLQGAGLLVLQRVGHVLAALLFAALVPRLMGPDIYGRYALLGSLAGGLILISGLGLREVIGRYAPLLVAGGDRVGLRRLFSQLVAVQAMTGAAATVVYFVLGLSWLREFDGVVILATALTVLGGAVASLLFAIFLGLNRAARWGLGELTRRWLILGALPLGFLAGGLRGACVGWLFADLLVLALGLVWAWPYLSRDVLRPEPSYVVPYLRFGAAFFASRLLFVAAQASGEPLIRAVTGDYAVVGYFTLANSVSLVAASAVRQFTAAFTPLLTVRGTLGPSEELRRPVTHLVRWLAIAGVVAVLGTLFLADDLVPLVLGRAYGPVAANLVPLMLSLCTLALSVVGETLAVSLGRTRPPVLAATVRLGAFWAMGVPLVAWQGSFGVCVAVLAASILSTACLVWGLRDVMGQAVRSWVWVTALGGLLVPLSWLRSSGPLNVGLCALALTAYAALLLGFRIVTVAEIGTVWRALDPRRPIVRES